MNLNTWLIIGLSCVIIAMILFWPNKQDLEQVIKANQRIEQTKAANTVLSAQVEVLAKELNDATEKARVSEIAHNQAVKEIKARIVIKRVIVQPLIDSIAPLREFVAELDSLNNIQAVRIHGLTVEKGFQEQLFRDLITLKDSLLTGKDLIVADQSVIIESQEKQLRKAKRAGKFKAVLIPVALICGLFLGAQF